MLGILTCGARREPFTSQLLDFFLRANLVRLQARKDTSEAKDSHAQVSAALEAMTQRCQEVAEQLAARSAERDELRAKGEQLTHDLQAAAQMVSYNAQAAQPSGCPLGPGPRVCAFSLR